MADQSSLLDYCFSWLVFRGARAKNESEDEIFEQKVVFFSFNINAFHANAR